MLWVVFDIGGVMVRIRSTWGECADAIGIEIAPEVRGRSQGDFPLMDPYQAGKVETRAFVPALREYLGTETEDEAIAVHNGMLAEPFDGVAEIVGELRSRDVHTACLSNTNELHWPILRGSGAYWGIDRLELAVASHLLKLAKPQPEIYRAFEEHAGATPEEIYYFDDHPTYVAAAGALGWNAFQVAPSNGPASQIRAALEERGIL